MDEWLERLCDILDRELERQEGVRDLCAAQHEAVRTHDVASLQARTVAIQLLIKEAVHAEMERHGVLQRLVENMDLPPERQTLSELIRIVPSPWKERLQYFQSRLQGVMFETRALVRETSVLVRRSLRSVGQCLQVLHESAPVHAACYTERGEEGAAFRRPAVLLNQQG